MTPPGVSGMTGRPVHDIPVSPGENIFPACRLIFPVPLLENILPVCRICKDPAKRSKEVWLHGSRQVNLAHGLLPCGATLSFFFSVTSFAVYPSFSIDLFSDSLLFLSLWY